jgi:hypothetical protein
MSPDEHGSTESRSGPAKRRPKLSDKKTPTSDYNLAANQEKLLDTNSSMPDKTSSKVALPTGEFVFKVGDAGIKPEHAHSPTLADLKESLGTDDRDAISRLLTQATVLDPWLDPETNMEECLNSSLAIPQGIRLGSQIEALVGIQMLAVHYTAMDYLERAKRKDLGLEFREFYQNAANKLLRTFTMQVDCLNRHRGRMGQQVIVGNVNITDGSQAIVGSVSHAGPEKVSQNDDQKQVG